MNLTYEQLGEVVARLLEQLNQKERELAEIKIARQIEQQLNQYEKRAAEAAAVSEPTLGKLMGPDAGFIRYDRTKGNEL